MVTVRKSDARGHFDHGWLKTFHSFSFGDYYDPAHKGYRALRVINEDWVRPGEGFPTHAHRDMEIVTYILEGALEHTDSMGNTGVIYAGDVQRMSAGTGVQHSEYNASHLEPVHLLQIWFFPEKKNIEPGYEQKSFKPEEMVNRLRLIVSREGRENSVSLHQDIEAYDCRLEPVREVKHAVREGRGVWIQVTRGSIDFCGQRLETGDGASLEGPAEAVMTGFTGAHFLLFDLPE